MSTGNVTKTLGSMVDTDADPNAREAGKSRADLCRTLNKYSFESLSSLFQLLTRNTEYEIWKTEI